MMKKIVVLGSGLVTGPLFGYLLEQTDYKVVCASQDMVRAQELVNGYENGSACSIDVNNTEELGELVKTADLVISLLPYTFHVAVAKECIKYKKNMITASYVSEDMKKLDKEAKDAGITILNEIGLDPGIDHMSAMRIIHRVQRNGGKVVSFRSYCGGLPAPDSNDNPLGYKFSWSPRGVLMAGRNSAKYLRDGDIIDVDGSELFDNNWPYVIKDAGSFEVYPNRNSLPYVDIYGLEHLHTMFRGTFRYPGWCSFWSKMSALGWLNDADDKALRGKSWAEIMRGLVPGDGELLSDLCAHWGVDESSHEIEVVKWLGLLSESDKPEYKGNLLDVLCSMLVEKLKYQPGERDMTVLHHEFIAEYDDRQECITSTLVDFGIPNGDSSMSRTVTLPVAIAAKKMLESCFDNLSGVVIPVMPEIYNPVLDELENLGIKCVEKYEDYRE